MVVLAFTGCIQKVQKSPEKVWNEAKPVATVNEIAGTWKAEGKDIPEKSKLIQWIRRFNTYQGQYMVTESIAS